MKIRVIFLLAGSGLIAAGCSKTPETDRLSQADPASAVLTQTEPPPVLHVVGVYEGALPESADKRPWWAQCDEINRQAGRPSPASSTGFNGSPGDCNARTIRDRETRSVSVNITDDSSPIVLGLMSYESVTWKIETAPNVKIKKIVLAGYRAQRIEGTTGTPVDVYTYERTECEQCVQKGKYFYSYQGVPAEMTAAAGGLRAKSFQGNYTGGKYTVFRGTQ